VPTAAQFVNSLANHLRIPYNNSGSRDMNPANGWGSTDCSGFMVMGLKSIGINPGGTNSTGQEIWCRNNGRAISVSRAINTPGALLFVWGYGPEGHVACSDGRGGTLETPAYNGYGRVSGRGKAHGRGWTGGGLVPGLSYGGAPAPGPAPSGGGTLQVGSTGIYVSIVQGGLNRLAYNAGAVDGVFGQQTKNALMAFQRSHGLVADGVYGPQTAAALGRALGVGTPAPAPAPAPGLNPLQKYACAVLAQQAGWWPTMSQGSYGEAVKQLQNALNLGTGNQLVLDGSFGPATHVGVVNFQRFFKLAADGVVGPATRAMLSFVLTAKSK